MIITLIKGIQKLNLKIERNANALAEWKVTIQHQLENSSNSLLFGTYFKWRFNHVMWLSTPIELSLAQFFFWKSILAYGIKAQGEVLRRGCSSLKICTEYILYIVEYFPLSVTELSFWLLPIRNQMHMGITVKLNVDFHLPHVAPAPPTDDISSTIPRPNLFLLSLAPSSSESAPSISGRPPVTTVTLVAPRHLMCLSL